MRISHEMRENAKHKTDSSNWGYTVAVVAKMHDSMQKNWNKKQNLERINSRWKWYQNTNQYAHADIQLIIQKNNMQHKLKQAQHDKIISFRKKGETKREGQRERESARADERIFIICYELLQGHWVDLAGTRARE